jgi:hypothetical protein
MDLNEAWSSFMDGDTSFMKTDDNIREDKVIDEDKLTFNPSKLKISTQTKITYLNIVDLDMHSLFWAIPIIKYENRKNGILKKQMKTTVTTKEESLRIEERIKNEYNGYIQNISILDNPNLKKNTYKKVDKISIGISTKDLLYSKSKKNVKAFFNCFALIFRILVDNSYKEYHVKLFNTGKVEVPGITDVKILYHIMELLCDTLNFIDMFNYTSMKNPPQLITYNKNIKTILINSNFNCGFHIKRREFSMILKNKYNIMCSFDSCEYPGIQCKYYYNEDYDDGCCHCSNEKKCTKKGTGKGNGNCKELSFMIFRTGSVLIVGNCNENLIYKIYDFLIEILRSEYTKIGVPGDCPVKKKSIPKYLKYCKHK